MFLRSKIREAVGMTGPDGPDNFVGGRMGVWVALDIPIKKE